MKRLFDIIFAGILGLVLTPLIGIIWVAIKLDDWGPSIYWSKRVGILNRSFLMPKFRSMKMETPQVATHLLIDPDLYLTRIGKFLRKYSLDEIPQIWSVFIGDMSIVGPRPALFNQDDLITARTGKGIHTLKPGITGWAQINGRDEIAIPEKVELDDFYLKNRSFFFDLKIVWLTFFKVISKEGVSH